MSELSFEHYDIGDFYDEVFSSPGQPYPGCLPLVQRINELPDGELRRRHVALASGAAPPAATPTEGTFRGTGASSDMKAHLEIETLADIREATPRP